MNHLFPRYHLRPPRGFINDPNGPVLVDDLFHIYFQSRPTTDTGNPVQWGHATSTDLVRWRLHRPAMTPEPDGLDRDGCFSGNTIATPEGIRAFYSGHIEGKPYQSVLTALSRDGGFTFGPATQVIVDPTPDEAVMMFRDPFVWRAADSWRMVVGSEAKGELAAVRLYESSDLQHWTYAGHLAELPRTSVDGFDTGAGWECPQVVTIDNTDVIIVAAWSQVDLSGAVLSIGPGSLQRVDSGTNFYAASVLRQSPYGPLMFGWVTEGSDPGLWRTRGWAGAISLPRVLTLGVDGNLRYDPVPTLTALRHTPAPAQNATVPTSAFELALPHISGTTRVTFGAYEHLDIEIDIEGDTLTFDRDHSSSAPSAHRGRHTTQRAFDTERAADAARVFIDGSIVEIFTSGGRVATTRVYPTTPPPWFITSVDGAVVYSLASEATPRMIQAAALARGTVNA